MRIVILLTFIALVGITYSKNVDINKDSNLDPDDDLVGNSILKTTSITTTTDKTSLASITCEESNRCGCYKGNCWSYIDEKQSPATGWWCFTQREGVRGRQKAWAKCTDNNECSWTMTCGDCYTFVGVKKGIKTDKILC
jgi:hypothetical protein